MRTFQTMLDDFYEPFDKIRETFCEKIRDEAIKAEVDKNLDSHAFLEGSFKAKNLLEKLMAQENFFHFAFKYTLGNEGGYTNIAQDRGGPTNWGITQDDLHRWRKKPVSPYDVRTMHQAEAEAIYKAWYWDTLSLDDILSCPIATAIFDIGVVRGISRSARYAQRVCAECGWSPEVVVDGQVGPKTISVLNQLDEKEFVRRFSALALNGFRGIVENNPTQKIFLRGWENRAKRLLTLV